MCERQALILLFASYLNKPAFDQVLTRFGFVEDFRSTIPEAEEMI